MAGTRTAPVNTTPNYFAADVQQDTNTFLANDQALIRTVYGGWNVLLSGGLLTAGSGMQVNVAGAAVVANGVVITVPGGALTVAAANPSNPRYDLVYGLVGTTAGTNPSGQPNVTDSATLGLQTGTAAASPTKATLPGPTYVQIGSIYVPAGAASAVACTLNSGDTLPNAQAGKTLVDLLAHIAASQATAVVHGYQATAPGGADLGRLAATDGTFGAVGRALALYSAGRGFLNSDAFDASGAAAAVNTALGTETTNRANGDAAVQANLTAHAGAAVTGGTVHGLRLQVVTLAGIFATSGANPTIVNFTFGPFASVAGGWANFTGDTNVNDDFTNPEVAFSDTSHGSLRFKTAGTWTGSAQILVLGA